MLKTYYNIKCDCCGKQLDENGSESQTALRKQLQTQNWKSTQYGRHYCNDCWTSESDNYINTKDGKSYRVDPETGFLIEVTPKKKLPIGRLMGSLDVTIAYCPECGRMTEISYNPEDVITLPDGTTGVETYCPECECEFFAKE